MKLILFLYFMGWGMVYFQLSSVFNSSPPPAEQKTGSRLLKMQAAAAYCKTQNMDTSFCVFIDYGKHSGLKRAYLINLKEKIEWDSFMVSHGCGNHPWGKDHSKNSALFSNESGSHLSSLGKYRIGNRAYSAWGIHVKYFLHGLDSSNSQAFQRTIVLHAWDEISGAELYPKGCPEGWGCPAFSNKDMVVLDSILQQKRKPVLLWSYQNN